MTSGASVRRQVGDDPEGKRLRQTEDFYRTGEIATRALLAVEKFPGVVWECACGSGDMSRVLETAPEIDHVFSSDLYDRGYGAVGPDFLQTPAIVGIDHIVTNPPFKFAEQFILKALALDPPGKIAMIARTLFLEGSSRYRRLWKLHPPARIWIFSFRIPMTRGDIEGERTGLVSFSWFIWEHGHVGPPTLGWL